MSAYAKGLQSGEPPLLTISLEGSARISGEWVDIDVTLDTAEDIVEVLTAMVAKARQREDEQ